MKDSPLVQLTPIRQNKPLNPSQVLTLRLGDVVGRSQLLSCLWAACGCCPQQKVPPKSSRHLCKDCRRIAQWALPSLSRQLLSYTTPGQVQVLKPHVTTLVKHKQRQRIVILPPSSSKQSHEEELALEFDWLETNCKTTAPNDDDSKMEEEDAAQVLCCNKRRVGCKDPVHEPKMSSTLLQSSVTITAGNVKPQLTSTAAPSETARQPFVPEPAGDDDRDNGTAETTAKYKNTTTTTVVHHQTKTSPSSLSKSLDTELPVFKSPQADTTTVFNNKNDQNDAPAALAGLQTSQKEDTLLGMTQTHTVQNSPPTLQHPDPMQSLKAANKFVIYFLRLGVDLSQHRIRLLTQRAQQQNTQGTTVVIANRFSPAVTHLVIGKSVTSTGKVAKALNFGSVDDLQAFLQKNHIQCVVPEWIARTQPLVEPKREFRWIWILDSSMSKNKKRKNQSLSPPPVVKQRRHNTNLELSAAFLQLSKLHQACPLLPTDEWKAYCFSVVAGRLRHLDFDVKHDTLERLANIRGFGTGTMDKIREFLTLGRIRRIHEFETDPDRMAMKAMMNIWGVGRVTAAGLVRDGYKTIDHVRKAVNRGKLVLERNQLIGVDCYEEICEDMTREEVQAIGTIILQRVKKMVPDAEISIMGSFRRQKPSCGDIDILITHPKHQEVVPRFWLGEIVDDLFRNGHIAFHLTYLRGMNAHTVAPEPTLKFISRKAWKMHRQHPKVTKSSSSYMGLFNSPTGKRRRVDIKFYPYRERAFAYLYFTGNGFFNRSVRLWSRHRGFSLNDQGLYVRDTAERALEADTERDVFQFLGLVYKEPHERDCFDAVIPEKSDGTDLAQLHMKQSDFHRDNEHAWIE